jgi:hypothetical protein
VALEFFETLPEVEKAFYNFFLKYHSYTKAEYNRTKGIWEAFADTILFDNPTFARKWSTWEACAKDRLIERASMAQRVIIIVDEDARMFSEYKTSIVDVSTPIIERPDPSSTRTENFVADSWRFPTGTMSSWHIEGDSLDPILINTADVLGVAAPRFTPKSTLDRVNEGLSPLSARSSTS